MKKLNDYSLSELKLIYSTLHTQIIEQPALMDSDLLHDLQVHLQTQAKANGIDVSAHTEWSNWLNEQNH